MRIVSFFVAAVFFVGISLSFKSPQTSSAVEEGPVHWMTFAEAQAAMKIEKKKLLVDVYTPWCGPCKMMMRDTFSDPKVAAYINANYYAIKFNAEGPDKVIWKGKEYANDKYVAGKQGRNGTHPLTYEIASVDGRVAYPTLVFFDENLELLTPVQGFLPPQKIEPIIKFLGDDHYKTSDYGKFMETFKGEF